MAEYIEIGQMWKCETCFHHRSGKCSPNVWCDNGESYRPDCNKLEKADVAPVVHGKWVISSDGYYPYCSVCLKTPERGVMTKHCPECGARMNGGAKDG